MENRNKIILNTLEVLNTQILVCNFYNFFQGQLVVNLKDFVVVRFAVGKGTKRFIARVENVENGEFLGNFLRPEYAEKTKNGCFNFLDNADITNFSFYQIESIMKPKFNRRGLLYFPQDASAK